RIRLCRCAFSLPPTEALRAIPYSGRRFARQQFRRHSGFIVHTAHEVRCDGSHFDSYVETGGEGPERLPCAAATVQRSGPARDNANLRAAEPPASLREANPP